MWIKNVPCHTSEQDAVAMQLSATAAARGGVPRGTGMGEKRMQAPDGSGAEQRNYFSEPRLWHLSIHRKVLNSLTRHV